MNAQMLEVSLTGVGTVLRLERDAWSMVKCPRQVTNEYVLPPPTPSLEKEEISGTLPHTVDLTAWKPFD